MSEEIRRLGGSKNIRDPLSVSGETAGQNRQEIYEFGPFRLEPAERKLLRGGEVVALPPKVFELLVILIRNSGHLLEKDDLIRSLWPDSFVEEGNLSNNIFVLRKALGNYHEYIETIPRRGYRFVGSVRQLPPAGRDAIPGALEEQRPEFPRRHKPTRWRILLAAATATLLLCAAVFLVFTGKHSISSPDPPHLAVEQRLTANASDVPVYAATISPDGKYLAYADPTGLYLRQISSGETERWSLPKNFDAIPWNWYPDGAHLLVLRDPRSPFDSSLPKSSLYKLSILGGEPQEIMSDVLLGGAVSPDGSRIAYVPRGTSSELWIMDSDGSNARRVVSGLEPNKGGTTRTLIWRVVWSPTGQHLAYIRVHYRNAPWPVQPISSLSIVDTDGGGASEIIGEDPRLLERALWWGQDDRLLFAYREDPSNTQRNYSVYSIRIDSHTRKAIGMPQAVTKAEGIIFGMNGTADGKRLVLWRQQNPAAQVFISDYDARTRQWNEPRRLIADANMNLAGAWTADSKAVFVVSNRNGTWTLFKQAIDETSPEILVEGRSISNPRLSPDGTQVLYLYSSNPDDPSFLAEIMSKPIAGGTPRVVIQGKGIDNFQCGMTPSRVCLFSQVDGDDYVFRAFDPEHGAGRELLRLPYQTGFEFRGWRLSPDGLRLAIFIDFHRIRFFSVKTGAAHDVTVEDWPLIRGDWAANGQTLFMPSHTPGGVAVILEVDQTGRAKVVLRGKPHPNAPFGWMIQSPDSRHAVLGEFIPVDSNAWILNDF